MIKVPCSSHELFQIILQAGDLDRNPLLQEKTNKHTNKNPKHKTKEKKPQKYQNLQLQDQVFKTRIQG